MCCRARRRISSMSATNGPRLSDCDDWAVIECLLNESCPWDAIPGRAGRLNSAHQQKNDDDQQNQTQTATRVVSPASAVGPGGKSADEQQQQDNDEDS